MEYTIEGVQVDENPSGLLITSIDGLGPGKATVNSTEIPTSDGDVVNSVRLSGKNIVINGKFLGAPAIEDARLLSYKYFPIKQKINFYIETDNRTASIDGYVESNEPVVFEDGCGCQISIKCEKAYFDGEVITTEFANGNRSAVIPYSGDINAGVKMEFELHPDSAVDSLNVTSIDIFKENEKMFGLDMGKLNKFVPNSAGEGHQEKQVYILNDEKYKHLTTLPFDDDDPFGNRVFYFTSCNDKIHWFAITDMLRGRGHVTIDMNTQKVEVLPDLDEDGVYLISRLKFVLPSAMGTMYYLNPYNISSQPRSFLRGVYKFSQGLNDWVRVCDIDDVFSKYGDVNLSNMDVRSVTYNDVIHIFITITDKVEVNGHTLHYRFSETADTKWKFVEDLSITYPELFPSGSNNHFEINNARLVEYNDRLHIFGGDPSEDDLNHYTWDGLVWRNEALIPLVDGVEHGSYYICPTVRNGSIYFFTTRYVDFGNSEAMETTVYKYNSIENSFQQLHTMPFGIRQDCKAISNDEYTYILALGGLDYTESPNNVKMIENDRIVINTNRGKRSASLIRNGVKYNILNILDKNPKWIELQSGDNKLAYSAVGDSDKMRLTVTTTEQYEGV